MPKKSLKKRRLKVNKSPTESKLVPRQGVNPGGNVARNVNLIEVMIKTIPLSLRVKDLISLAVGKKDAPPTAKEVMEPIVNDLNFINTFVTDEVKFISLHGDRYDPSFESIRPVIARLKSAQIKLDEEGHSKQFYTEELKLALGGLYALHSRYENIVHRGYDLDF